MQTLLYDLPPDLPTLEVAMQRLGNVPATLWGALEHAAFKTSSFRQAEAPGRRLDEGLSATLFRHHAIDFLNSREIDAQDDALSLKYLPFLGISFYHDHFHVRVLKGKDRILPGCGPSRKKRRFYNQIASSYLIGNQPARTTANLIVLWDFNAAYGLDELLLVLPAKGALQAKDVSIFWMKPIPHPAEEQASGRSTPPDGDDGLGGIISRLDEDAKRQGEVNER